MRRWPNKKLTQADGERILWHALEHLQNQHEYAALWLREHLYDNFVSKG